METPLIVVFPPNFFSRFQSQTFQCHKNSRLTLGNTFCVGSDPTIGRSKVITVLDILCPFFYIIFITERSVLIIFRTERSTWSLAWICHPVGPTPLLPGSWKCRLSKNCFAKCQRSNQVIFKRSLSCRAFCQGLAPHQISQFMQEHISWRCLDFETRPSKHFWKVKHFYFPWPLEIFFSRKLNSLFKAYPTHAYCNHVWLNMLFLLQ